MDPSIVKFLEEDEDETMHSGADVEAFTAALNRDIEGDNNNNNSNNNNNNNNNNTNSNTSTPQPTTTTTTTTDTATALSQGTSHTPSQVFQQWQSSKCEEEVKSPTQEQQQPSAMEINRYGSSLEPQHPPNDSSRDVSQPSKPKEDPSLQQPDQHNVHVPQVTNTQNADKNPAQNITQTQEDEAQMQRMQRVSNQQAANKPAGKQVPFALLLPVIEPQLDKDRAMQLQGLYVRLRSNNINKEEFVRHMRSLVGDHMLKMAVYKLQQGKVTAKPSGLPMDNNAQKQRLLDHQSDSHGAQTIHKPSNVNPIKQERDPFPMQGLGKQHQQHMPFPQQSFPNYGNTPGNYSSPNMNMPAQPFKQQARDLQMRQGPVPNAFNDMKRMHTGGLAHFTGNSAHWQQSMHKDQSMMPSMGYAKQEPLDQMNDPHKSQMSAPQSQIESSKDESFEMMSSRPGFSSSMNKPEVMSITAQLERQNASAGNSSLASGSNAKTPPKKPTVGQKKPSETPISSLSKKQKVSGTFSDQSIEQLNDVTAVSGVNLREEEEQLFSGSKEDSRVSEASRKVVQEEEERLILQKTPLQKKLAEIMTKCGVKNRSNDVERCLSLCVEERMRGLISNLIRVSKQRVDIEKPRHQTVVTSDVRKQIMSMNQKAREEWEKKQADAEKLQRADEPEGSGDGEDGRGKSLKANKEEDDKMRATAANVAARAAVGGDDMLSKWQLMAEQNRQKREGGTDTGSTSQPSIDVRPKLAQSSTERTSKDNPDTERMTSNTVTANPGPVIRKPTRNQELAKSGSIPRTITVKDVISVLGREIQMSRSTLIYRLYEKVRSESASE
ncbi:transcription initiation factor TFIID subunit 4b-like isoform X1 [Bidens hawaiensis]|uniref:transcription initiation factor TFIID subunit 4b-like isoform X1 n=1 Tax=Bidens hawaiensis TaxID=980011 RepID=UPI00404988B7